MSNVTLTKSEANALAVCLGATPPKMLPSLGELFLQDKLRTKFYEPTEDLRALQSELETLAQAAQVEIASAPNAERAAKVVEVNARLKPQTDKANAVGLEEVSVELSDEQAKYLKDHYMDRIAINFNQSGYAAKVASKLGLE